MKCCFILGLAFITLTIACKKDSDGNPGGGPAIRIDSTKLLPYTKAVISITLTNITGTVQERGLTWSNTASPTLRDNKIIDPGGPYGFSMTMENLLPFTTYHIRAYAIMIGDTLFSKDVEFTTKGLNILFAKEYIKPGASPDIVDVAGDETSGFVVLCRMSTGNGTHSRLIKVDAAGNEAWSHDYNTAEWKEPKFVRKMNDGYIIGTTWWRTADVATMLLKTDLNGNVLWEKEYSKNNYQFFVHCKPDNGNFVLTIKSLNTNDMLDPNRKISLWDFTVDNNGNLVNEKEYPNFNNLARNNINFYSIETADKGFVGFSDIYDENSTGHNIRAHKFSAANAVEWEKTYGDEAFEYVTDGAVGATGNYLFSASKDYAGGDNNAVAWFFEIDKNNGDQTWQYRYSSSKFGEDTGPVAFDVTHSGSYYAAGLLSNYTSVWKTMPLILKFENNGQLAWDYIIEDNNGYQYSRASKIYVAPNKDIYLFGLRNSNMSQSGFVYMMKLREQP